MGPFCCSMQSCISRSPASVQHTHASYSDPEEGREKPCDVYLSPGQACCDQAQEQWRSMTLQRSHTGGITEPPQGPLTRWQGHVYWAHGERHALGQARQRAQAEQEAAREQRQDERLHARPHQRGRVHARHVALQKRRHAVHARPGRSLHLLFRPCASMHCAL